MVGPLGFKKAICRDDIVALQKAEFTQLITARCEAKILAEKALFRCNKAN
jgi:hypothetical protein